MIRATKGTSMDGWMDGWMDGEVLIIGRVVGWSGWVPKGLPCGGPPKVHGSVLRVFFGRVFFGDFWRFGAVLKGFGRPKWE